MQNQSAHDTVPPTELLLDVSLVHVAPMPDKQYVDRFIGDICYDAVVADAKAVNVVG